MQEKIKNKGNTVTFEEVLMRLSPSNNRKLQQVTQLDFFFEGTEITCPLILALRYDASPLFQKI